MPSDTFCGKTPGLAKAAPPAVRRANRSPPEKAARVSPHPSTPPGSADARVPFTVAVRLGAVTTTVKAGSACVPPALVVTAAGTGRTTLSGDTYKHHAEYDDGFGLLPMAERAAELCTVSVTLPLRPRAATSTTQPRNEKRASSEAPQARTLRAAKAVSASSTRRVRVGSKKSAPGTMVLETGAGADPLIVTTQEVTSTEPTSWLGSTPKRRREDELALPSSARTSRRSSWTLCVCEGVCEGVRDCVMEGVGDCDGVPDCTEEKGGEEGGGGRGGVAARLRVLQGHAARRPPLTASSSLTATGTASAQTNGGWGGRY